MSTEKNNDGTLLEAFLGLIGVLAITMIVVSLIFLIWNVSWFWFKMLLTSIVVLVASFVVSLLFESDDDGDGDGEK